MTSKLAKWTFIGWILWMLFCITNGGDLLWCNIVFVAPFLLWGAVWLLCRILVGIGCALNDGWNSTWTPRPSRRRGAGRAWQEYQLGEYLLRNSGLDPTEYKEGRRMNRSKYIRSLSEILGLGDD